MNGLFKRILCTTPRIELHALKDEAAEHAWLWFDHTICDLNTSAFQRLASNLFALSGGCMIVDLRKLKCGRIDFWANPAASSSDFGAILHYNYPSIPELDRVTHTHIEAIDNCVELLRQTCTRSKAFNPDLYPEEDMIRKNASER